MRNEIYIGLIGTMLALFSEVTAQADALLAYDQASDAAYSDGWQSGDAGGGNWGGGWSLNTSFPPDDNLAGHIIGSSQGNGFNDGNIDSSGRSFGLYANGSYSATATRPFSGSLGIGQSVIVDMDNGFIDNGSSVGFTLTGSGDPMSTEQFSFFFRGGESDYKYSTGQMVFLEENNTGINFTSGGLRVIFTLVDADSYSLDVTPNGGATSSFTGDFAIPADIDYIQVYNYNAGSGSSNDAFFNNIQIVPEPATASLLLLGLAGLLRRRNVRR